MTNRRITHDQRGNHISVSTDKTWEGDMPHGLRIDTMRGLSTAVGLIIPFSEQRDYTKFHIVSADGDRIVIGAERR